MLKNSIIASVQWSRRMGTDAAEKTIKNLAVIGGGIMGAGIAQVAAQTKHQVVIFDQSDEMLQHSAKNIRSSVEKIANKVTKGNENETKKMVETVIANITFTTDLKDCVKNADLVIEAVSEDLQLKRNIFDTIEQAAPKDSIFASNTSGLLIKNIAKNSNKKDKFGGLHFFNPVPIMKLVEVISTEETSEATRNSLITFGKKLNKVTVNAKDRPGFIVNRLLVPYTMDALLMVERGDATMEDIDIAMKLGCGHSIGPVTTFDLVGIDTGYLLTTSWARDYPEIPNFFTSKLLEQKYKEGKLGMKTGEGFYKYKKP